MLWVLEDSAYQTYSTTFEHLRRSSDKVAASLAVIRKLDSVTGGVAAHIELAIRDYFGGVPCRTPHQLRGIPRSARSSSSA
jgi:hypothetical protein